MKLDAIKLKLRHFSEWRRKNALFIWTAFWIIFGVAMLVYLYESRNAPWPVNFHASGSLEFILSL